MLKNYYILMLFSVLFLINGCNRVNNQKNIQDKNITELAKVNSHIITTQVLGKRANLFKILDKKTKKNLIDKLINDEILIQYILDKNSSYSKIHDENKRAKWGLLSLSNYFLKTSDTKYLSDENLFSIYKKNKKNYFHQELIEASHILVKTEAEANSIIKDLNNSQDINKTFIKIAKEKSLDKKTSYNGGYLGLFNPKNMVKTESFQNALNRLSPHQYTLKPIKTEYGYEIIYLHSKKPKGYFSFEEVKETIGLQLSKKKMNQWASRKLKELKKDAKIIYLYNK